MTEGPASKKKKNERNKGTMSNNLVVQVFSIEDRLEAFMDKLSMWQLVNKLDAAVSDVNKDKRDWMQIFCEDVVESQYVPSTLRFSPASPWLHYFSFLIMRKSFHV